MLLWNFVLVIGTNFNKMREDNVKSGTTQTYLSETEEYNVLLPFSCVFRFLMLKYGLLMDQFELSPLKNYCVLKALDEFPGYESVDWLDVDTDNDFEYKKNIVFSFSFRKRRGERVKFYFVGRYEKGLHELELTTCFTTDKDKSFYPFCAVIDLLTIAASCFHIRVKARLQNRVMDLLETKKMFHSRENYRSGDNNIVNKYMAGIHRSLIGYLLCK
jgi:hypothetical protein